MGCQSGGKWDTKVWQAMDVAKVRAENWGGVAHPNNISSSTTPGFGELEKGGKGNKLAKNQLHLY